MLTKYGKLVKYLCTETSANYQQFFSIENAGSNVPGTIRVYAINKNAERWISPKGLAYIGGNSIGSNIVLGGGNTPPTENDYKLEQPITSGITASAASASQINYNDGVMAHSYDYVLTNTTNEDRIIREYGTATSVASSGSENANVNTNAANIAMVLMSREVLAEPLMVPANSQSSIRITQEYNYGQFLPLYTPSEV